MAASGNSIALKSFQSFTVNEGLLAKVVEAVKSGEKEARTSGDVKSFEVFYKGFRQNIAIGRIYIVPVKVCNNFQNFPISLLYGTVVRELNLGEEVADLIEKKIGETEFDEYSQLDIQKIKDTLFKDAESEEHRSLILFAPHWSNIREYVVFKFTGDDEKLSNLLRHQIFSAYFNPAVSAAFDALMTTVDTNKMDLTDITPKLTYPFITENPLKAYPDLQKQGGWTKPKVFLTKKTADAITKDVLDPQELNVFEALDSALTSVTMPETEGMDEVADFKGPDGSNHGNAETPQVEGEQPTVADLKDDSGAETGLRRRPDYGESDSYTSDVNKENSKGASAKTAKFDYNATNCPDCGKALDVFHICPTLDPKDARLGMQFCGKGHPDNLYVSPFWSAGASGDKDKTAGEDAHKIERDLGALMRKARAAGGSAESTIGGFPVVCSNGVFNVSEGVLETSDPVEVITYISNMQVDLKNPPAQMPERRQLHSQFASAEPAPFEAPFTNVGPGTSAHDNAEKAIAVKVDTISTKGEPPIGIELDNTGLPVRTATTYPQYTVNGRACTSYEDAKQYWESKGGTLMEKLDAKTPAHVLQEKTKVAAVDHIAAEIWRGVDDNGGYVAMSTKSKAAADKREAELNKKYAGRKKVADVPLTEDSIWSDLMEDFGEAPQVELPGEGSGGSKSTDSLPEAMTSEKPEEAKAVTEKEIDKAEPKGPKSKMFQKKNEPKAEEPKEEKKEEPEEKKEESKEASSKTAILYMNDYDIQMAQQILGSDPVLGPAVRFLDEFRNEVNEHSDGWAYWSAPLKAAAALMTLIQAGVNARREGKAHGVTVENLKRAMAPIKAFMTRRGLAAGMQMPKLAVKKNAAEEPPIDMARYDAIKTSPRINNLSVPEKHQLRIALDTVREYLDNKEANDADEVMSDNPTGELHEEAHFAGKTADVDMGQYDAMKTTPHGDRPNPKFDAGMKAIREEENREPHEEHQAAAGDENDEEVEMGLGDGDLADLAANLPSEIKTAEWKEWDDNMPVQVVGVKNGQPSDRIWDYQEFPNLAAAKQVFPDLDPRINGKQFTWAMRGQLNGQPAIRFETWAANERFSA